MEPMIPKARPLPNGLVIMFEGLDGTGKTTQIDLLSKALEEAGWTVLVTRNLGGTPIGEALREVIMSPLLKRPPLTDFYTSLAIQEPLFEVIDTARQQGKIVLMDRGPLSLAAYQIYGGGVEATLGWRHVERGMSRIKPDATILYDMDPQAALERNRQHPEKTSYFESQPLDYFQKVADGFRTAAERYPAVKTVDAAQDIPTIHEQTVSIITPLLS